MEPPAAAPSKRVEAFSHGRAEASLPTLAGLYWGGVAGVPAPAPW